MLRLQTLAKMLLTDLACYGRISKVFVFYFLTLSPCRIFCQELFCDGLSLVEICDFGTVLYPFTTTINKVLYSVFVSNFSNGFWDLKFEIKIYKGHSAESQKCALMLNDLILCCKDCRRSLFGIFLVSMEIFVFACFFFLNQPAGAVLLAPRLLGKLNRSNSSNTGYRPQNNIFQFIHTLCRDEKSVKNSIAEYLSPKK